MILTIQDLFEQIRKISKQKNQNNKSFDGKKFWQPIKSILSTSNWKASKWKNQSKKRYNTIMKLPEYFINGYGNNQIIKTNHFLIQTVRIPKNEKPSLKKICQIALNIGQYQGTTNKTIENNNIKDYLLKSDCKILLKDILEKNKILELEKLLK